MKEKKKKCERRQMKNALLLRLSLASSGFSGSLSPNITSASSVMFATVFVVSDS